MSKTKTTKKTAPRKATKSAKAAPSKKAGATKRAATKSKTASANGQAKTKKLSAIDAAAKVLENAKSPMSTKEMIDAMAAKGLWKSPGGKTPHATLYSAILREIGTKGKDARFKKTERGKFAANG